MRKLAGCGDRELLPADSSARRPVYKKPWRRCPGQPWPIGLVLVGGSLLIAAGCFHPAARTTREGTSDALIRATVTVGMLGDLVREVGRDRVSVTQVMGPGVDPHLYKPTRDDVEAILDADIVFFVGLKLEGKMSDVLSRVGRTKPAIAVGEKLDPAVLIRAGDNADHTDPHVWMDVSLWMQGLEAVATALSEFDPEHAEAYHHNASDYRARLDQLHRYGQTSLATVPPERRVLVTSHDAFHYFGRAYGLEVRGVQGISTDSEAGLQQVNGLVDLIVDRSVKAVFIESSVPRKSIEAVVEGVRSRQGDVSIGGMLFSDAMGEAGTYEGTYEGMLDHNITVVTRALGGDAPPHGMTGRLTVIDRVD